MAHKSPEPEEERHVDLAVFLLFTRADSPVPSLLWWTFYSGLEHMTILGHQQGPSYMLLPLRPHCAASDLMSQQRLWRFLLVFHNSQLSVSCGPKPLNVALNHELVNLRGSSWEIGLIKAFLSIFWGLAAILKCRKLPTASILDFHEVTGGWCLHCSEIQYEWASILCWVTQLTGSVS